MQYFIRNVICIEEFLYELSSGKKIDRWVGMIETVVQNEDILCPCIIDKSNLDSAFLKTRTSPICSHKAVVCLFVEWYPGQISKCHYIYGQWLSYHKQGKLSQYQNKLACSIVLSQHLQMM
jgi:hypothetical protein